MASRTRTAHRSSRRRSPIARGVVGLCVAACCLTACRDPRLATEEIEPVEVRTISAYGLVLGPQASPKDVAYVLLRAIRDDVLATRRNDGAAAKSAWAVQRSVAAPERIHAEWTKLLRGRPPRVHVTPTEVVYTQARFWAPIVAHYVDALDLTREQAEEKMRVVDLPPDGKHVVMDVENPNDHSKTTLSISLTREKGYWRVHRVAYSSGSVARSADRKTVEPSDPAAGGADARQRRAAPHLGLLCCPKDKWAGQRVQPIAA